MITRKVQLAFVGGLDLIYIHQPNPLIPHWFTLPLSPETLAPQLNTWPIFLSVERQFLKKLLLYLRPHSTQNYFPYIGIALLTLRTYNQNKTQPLVDWR